MVVSYISSLCSNILQLRVQTEIYRWSCAKLTGSVFGSPLSCAFTKSAQIQDVFTQTWRGARLSFHREIKRWIWSFPSKIYSMTGTCNWNYIRIKLQACLRRSTLEVYTWRKKYGRSLVGVSNLLPYFLFEYFTRNFPVRYIGTKCFDRFVHFWLCYQGTYLIT